MSTTRLPGVTAENVILSGTGVVYLVTEGTEVHIGRYRRALTPAGVHVAHVGPSAKRIEARDIENLKQLIAHDWACDFAPPTDPEGGFRVIETFEGGVSIGWHGYSDDGYEVTGDTYAGVKIDMMDHWRESRRDAVGDHFDLMLEREAAARADVGRLV